jgi:hypothetical protein
MSCLVHDMKTALVMFQLKHFRNQPVFRLTNKTFSKTIYIHTIKQYKIIKQKSLTLLTQHHCKVE